MTPKRAEGAVSKETWNLDIDLNPFSITAENAFYGITISIFQHPEISIEPKQKDLKIDIEDPSIKLEPPESYEALSPTVNRKITPTHEAMIEMRGWLEHLAKVKNKTWIISLETVFHCRSFTHRSLPLTQSNILQYCSHFFAILWRKQNIDDGSLAHRDCLFKTIGD